MAIATYSDLQTAIANYLARPGDALVSTPAPDFVTLAESRIAYGGDLPYACRPLRIRAMEAVATLITGPAATGGTSTGSANAQIAAPVPAPANAPGNVVDFVAGFSNTGAATFDAGGGPLAIKKGVPQADVAAGDIVAGGGYELYCDGTAWNLVPEGGVPLPAGYLEMRSIYLQTSPPSKLSPVAPETIDSTWMSASPDQPAVYALDGDCIRFAPPADSSYAVRMGFYKKFGPLASAPNWLMTNKPDVYLYGALLEAAIYFGNEEDAQKFYGVYCSAVNGLQAANATDRYSGGALQMRSNVAGA